MTVFDAQWVAKTLDTELSNSSAYSRIWTDTRSVQAGDLFIALRGESFDAHDFLSQAIEKGASALVMETRFQAKVAPALASFSGDLFWVSDTHQAYQALGKAWRKKFKIPFIAVAGSQGKTTTKELLAASLRGKWGAENVLSTQGSQNGYLGIPMTLLQVREHHRVAVIEVGIDEVGAMAQHMEVVQPTHGVLTSIGPEHLHQLKNLETVAKEERVSLEWIHSHQGKIALNLDDPEIATLQSLTPPKPLTYSLHEGEPGPDHLKATLLEGGTRLQIEGAAWSSFEVNLPLPGEHNAQNLLSALAIGALLEIDPPSLQKGLAQFQPAFGRTQVQDWGEVKVLCDYYNANPTSVRAALKLLGELHTSRKGSLWVALGEMRELGENEIPYHKGLFTPLRDAGIHHVLLYGELMKHLAEELKNEGFSGSYRHYSDKTALAETLIEGLRGGDSLLIKGSRGLQMEEIWKFLQEHGKKPE